MLFEMPVWKSGGGVYNYLLQCISLWKLRHGGRDRRGERDKVAGIMCKIELERRGGRAVREGTRERGKEESGAADISN